MSSSSVNTFTRGKWAVLFLALLVVPEFAFAQIAKKSAQTPAPKPAPAQKTPTRTPVPGGKTPTPTPTRTPVPGGKTPTPTPAGTVHNPDGSTTTTHSNGSSTTYDGNGKPTRVTTAGGATAKFDSKGHVSAINFKSSKSYDTNVSHGAGGTRTIKSEHVNDRGEHITMVNTGANRGYVDHTFTRNGQPYMRRTVAGGQSHAVVYRGYYYGGRPYFAYVPGYYYAPGFYGWAYAPWGTPVAFAWGWGPWYGAYGYYFAPYPAYAGPAFWLTDYVVAENLQAGYEARGVQPTPASGPVTSSNAATVTVPGNQAWTQTGTVVNAGDEITISATGGVSFSSGSEALPPAGVPENCFIAANGPYGWRAHAYLDNKLPCTSLVGRIGDGQIFYVGNGTTLRAPNSGELLLGVNDNYFPDNSGSWTATVSVGTATPPAQPMAGSPTITPEVKAAISDEVKSDLASEQAISTAPPTQSGTAPTSDVPAALDPKQRTFIVSTALSEKTTDGSQCSLSTGDVLTRIDNTPDTNQNVTSMVTSSQKGDCPSGAMLAVSIQDLQDMHNAFVEKIDAGLQKLADNQGKNGMPASPATGRRASLDGQAQPDITAAADLQQQQTDANNAEKEVNQAVAPGQGN